MKERITERDWHDAKFKDIARSLNENYERSKLKKLWQLEDKIENRTLIELPCKVGDKVYFVSGSMKQIFENSVKKIIYDTGNEAFDDSAIGKNVFLTKAEAEARLKVLNGD